MSIAEIVERVEKDSSRSRGNTITRKDQLDAVLEDWRLLEEVHMALVRWNNYEGKDSDVEWRKLQSALDTLRRTRVRIARQK